MRLGTITEAMEGSSIFLPLLVGGSRHGSWPGRGICLVREAAETAIPRDLREGSMGETTLGAKEKPAATGEQTDQRRRRARGQRGAEALGGAFVMMLLLPLMFLIVDIAWGVFVKVTLQHAVREGVRYAITSQTSTNAEGANLGHLGSIKARTIAAAGGILAGQEHKVTVTFYTPDSLVEDTSATRNRGGNVVMVNIENYEYRPLIPVYTIGDWQKLEILQDPPIRITVHAADRMESCPLGVCAPL